MEVEAEDVYGKMKFEWGSRFCDTCYEQETSPYGQPVLWCYLKPKKEGGRRINMNDVEKIRSARRGREVVQSVNTTYSAVRLTRYRFIGAVWDERSQLKTRKPDRVAVAPYEDGVAETQHRGLATY
jgi:protein subunit release factor A